LPSGAAVVIPAYARGSEQRLLRGSLVLADNTFVLRGTNPPLSHPYVRCTIGRSMRVPDELKGDLYLGLAVTSLYTLTTMGLIIAFT
jgi:hypothetical protein